MSRQNEKSPQPRRRRLWVRVDPAKYATLNMLKRTHGVPLNTIISNGIDLEVDRLNKLGKSKRSARGASQVAQ